MQDNAEKKAVMTSEEAQSFFFFRVVRVFRG